MRRAGALLGILALLTQLFAFGQHSAATAAVALRDGALPFDQIVICTPTGVKVVSLSELDFGDDDEKRSGSLPNPKICPLCCGHIPVATAQTDGLPDFAILSVRDRSYPPPSAELFSTYDPALWIFGRAPPSS